MHSDSGYTLDEQGRPVYDLPSDVSVEQATPSVPASFSTEVLHKLQKSLPVGLPSGSLPSSLSNMKGRAAEALSQCHAIASDSAAAAASLAKINLQHADTFAPPPDAEMDEAALIANMQKIREESRLTCILIFEKHLDEFLSSRPSEGPNCPTYEDWIRDLHPENARGANKADGDGQAADDLAASNLIDFEGAGDVKPTAAPTMPPDVDHRFYLTQSDHLQMWNADPRTIGRRVSGPPGSPNREHAASRDASKSSNTSQNGVGDLLDLEFMASNLPASMTSASNAAPTPLPPPTDLVMRLQQQHAHLSRLRHALQSQAAPPLPTAYNGAGATASSAPTPLVLHLQSSAPNASQNSHFEASRDPFAELGHASLAPPRQPSLGAFHSVPQGVGFQPTPSGPSGTFSGPPHGSTTASIPAPPVNGIPSQTLYRAASSSQKALSDPFSELCVLGPKPPGNHSLDQPPQPTGMTTPASTGLPSSSSSQRPLDLGAFDPLSSSKH